MITYNNQALGVAFTYPIDWTLEISQPTSIPVTAGPGAFVVARADLTGPTTLSDQLSLFLTSFPSGTTFNGTSKINIKGGVPGYRITAEWPADESRLRGVFVLGVKGARVFSLGAFAKSDVFEKFGEDFGRTTDSLRITLDSSFEPIDATGEPLETLDIIGARVTKIRGLSPPSTVKPRLLSREEFEESVESEIVDDQMRREADRLKGICVPLDLCSVSDDLLDFRLLRASWGITSLRTTPSQRSCGKKCLTLLPG